MSQLLARITILSYILAVTLITTSGIYIKNTYAACAVSDKNQGLVSSGGSITGDFGNLIAKCVVDPKAAYAPFKVPTYDDLKSLYFDQAKTSATVAKQTRSTCTSGNDTITGLDLRTQNLLVYATCNFVHVNDVSSPLAVATSNKTPIIFVDNHLYIDSNLNYGGETYGIVFIVKGDIYITPSVTNINAVLVSEGNIYTAYDVSDGNATNSVTGVSPLNINGSLLSITSTAGEKIYFNRSLNDNSVPAELVKFQPKYLVILRGLTTQPFSIQREITPDLIPSSVLPSPTTIPSPAVAPSSNPGSSYGNPFKIFTIFQLLNQLKI